MFSRRKLLKFLPALAAAPVALKMLSKTSEVATELDSRVLSVESTEVQSPSSTLVPPYVFQPFVQLFPNTVYSTSTTTTATGNYGGCIYVNMNVSGSGTSSVQYCQAPVCSL